MSFQAVSMKTSITTPVPVATPAKAMKPTMTATIVGPICESGDVLGHARKIAPAREGDVLLIGTTGAYGHAMASHYNLRPPPDERLIGPDERVVGRA